MFPNYAAARRAGFGMLDRGAFQRAIEDIDLKAAEAALCADANRQFYGEMRVTNAKTGGEKGSKPERMSLLPFDALRLVSKVYAFGAQKYAPNNWRKGYDWSLSFDALHRHLESFWAGDDLDEESGLPHLAHAAFHVLALIVFSTVARYAELDDRPRVEGDGLIDVAAKVAV